MKMGMEGEVNVLANRIKDLTKGLIKDTTKGSKQRKDSSRPNQCQGRTSFDIR